MLEFLKNIMFELIFIPIFLIFYLSFFIVYLKIFIDRKNERRIVNTVNTIFNSEELDKEHTLNLIVKEILTSKKIPYSDIKNSCDLLEYIFRKVTINSHNNTYLGIKFENETLVKIQNFIINIKNKDPFISLNSQYNYYFSSIYKAINENNKDYGLSMLNQLSKEFETIDEIIIQQNKRNKISYFVSCLGVILTIFFGIFSLIK